MKSLKSFEQIQRQVKHASKQGAEKHAKAMEAIRVEESKEAKLQERIAQENAKKALQTVQKKDPVKYKAIVELNRIWNSGKQGFIKHLVIAYGGGRTVPYLGSGNVSCALTRVKMFTLNDLLEKREEVVKASIADATAHVNGEEGNNLSKVLKGKFRAFTGEDTKTCLCDIAIEALFEFAAMKAMKGELVLTPAQRKGKR